MTRFNRRDFLQLTAGTGLLGLSGCIADMSTGTSENKDYQVSLEEGYWPMAGTTPANTGYHPNETGPKQNIKEKWRKSVGRLVATTPAIYDGKLFFGSHNSRLYAVDKETGETEWFFETDKFVYSSPAVVEGTVFFGGGDGKLYALDADTGNKKWSFGTGNGLLGGSNIISSSCKVSDNTVYIVGGSDKKLYAVDANSGKKKWSYKPGGEIRNRPAISDGYVYIGTRQTEDENVYALDAETGNKKWGFNTQSTIAGPPSVSGSNLYVASEKLFVIDKESGEKIWEFGSEGEGYVPNSPSIAGGKLYFGTGNKLYCVDIESKKEIWSFGSDIPFYSQVVVDGMVYAEGLRHLYGIDAGTGENYWKQYVTNNSAGVSVSNNTVFIGGGGILALKKP